MSIKLKLFGYTFAVVVAIVVFQVLFFPARQSSAATAALDEKAVAMAELVAHNVSTGLEFQQRDPVDRVFKGAARDADLAYLVLYDVDGAEFASYKGDRAPAVDTARWTGKTRSWSSDGLVHVEAPVMSQGGVLGHLGAGYSKQRINAEIRANTATAGIVSLIIIVLGGAVSWLLGRSVGIRLENMADVARTVASGRLDLPPIAEGDTDELGQMARHFNRMLETLRRLEDHVGLVSQGNLTSDIRDEGDLAEALNQMVSNQRELVMQISETASAIRVASSEILDSSRLQERGANEQAAFVEETLRTMDSLLDSAKQIAETSHGVLEHAERTHTNNEMIAERITQLAGHTRRIGEFLEVIKDIANKSELLALNAALEGTRAGEAGRGFSLVATQMQRLTENVMGAVSDIKQLTDDIREATSASVLATEEATKRASSTSESARRISLIIQQQKSGTEQVSQSMNDISEIIRKSAAASTQNAQSAEELEHLSERLQALVQRFDLERDSTEA